MGGHLIDSKAPTPIRTQFRSIIVERIAQGAYAADRRIPSERDLATQFGISRTSVRETLAELISEGVLFRSGRGTFVAAAAARRPTSNVRQIAMLISSEIFHFVPTGYDRILSGVSEVCLDAGCQVVFQPLTPDASPMPLGPNSEVGGFLIAGGIQRPMLEKLAVLSKPLVLVDLLLNSRGWPSVGIDYASGVAKAVDHLIALGHREIGFLGFPTSAKYEAYWRTLERHRLPYHPRHVRFLQLDELESGITTGYHAARFLMSGGSPPTALIATNDLVALGVMEALRVSGKDVPGYLSVIGCDDLDRTSNPPLTTIRVDLNEVGRIAARTLLDLAAGKAVQERVLVPVDLLVRGSTAPPRD